MCCVHMHNLSGYRMYFSLAAPEFIQLITSAVLVLRICLSSEHLRVALDPCTACLHLLYIMPHEKRHVRTRVSAGTHAVVP